MVSKREHPEFLGVQQQKWALEGDFHLFVHSFFLSFVQQMHGSAVSVLGTVLGNGEYAGQQSKPVLTEHIFQ